MINNSLETLHLEDNNISDAGAKYIATALRYNFNLKHVFLDNNNIGDKGVAAIGAAIGGNDGGRSNFCLTDLYLVSNKISNDGAAMLIEAFKTNRTVINFHLSNNNITTKVEHRIYELIERNRTFKFHKESLKKLGKDFYLRRHLNNSLSWADAQRVGDATTADGVALEVIHRLFHHLLKNDPSLQDELRSLVEQRLVYYGSDGHSNLFQIAAQKDSAEAQAFCRFLINKLGVDDFIESDGSKYDVEKGKIVSPVSLPNNRHRPGVLVTSELKNALESTLNHLHLNKTKNIPQKYVEQNPLRSYLEDVHVLRDIFQNQDEELVESLLGTSAGRLTPTYESRVIPIDAINPKSIPSMSPEKMICSTYEDEGILRYSRL
mmetsp:Transcript_20088/g.45531  ORF Transcript_20088/g.45531 Transcript_20088/m.45531 type:complete len:377 (-) Transcript_20088:588-1718(-)